jgi:uridine monophosphate synthetase
MALREDLMQDLVVDLYDRGEGLPSDKRILDIGTSKILKSGIWSPYLVNLRPVLSADVKSEVDTIHQLHNRDTLLQAMTEKLDDYARDVPFFHIFGLPEAGTPLASALAARSGRSLLWQRVKPKDSYGTHGDLEGVHYPGQTVIEIDDVVTTGDTKNEGAGFLAGYGLSTYGAVIAFDRDQGGREAVESMGIKVKAALGATAVFGYLLDAGRISTSEYSFLIDYTLRTPYPTKEPTKHPWK